MPLFHPALKKMVDDGIISKEAYQKCYRGETALTFALTLFSFFMLTYAVLSVIVFP